MFGGGQGENFWPKIGDFDLIFTKLKILLTLALLALTSLPRLAELSAECCFRGAILF